LKRTDDIVNIRTRQILEYDNGDVHDYDCLYHQKILGVICAYDLVVWKDAAWYQPRDYMFVVVRELRYNRRTSRADFPIESYEQELSG